MDEEAIEPFGKHFETDSPRQHQLTHEPEYVETDKAIAFIAFLDPSLPHLSAMLPLAGVRST